MSRAKSSLLCAQMQIILDSFVPFLTSIMKRSTQSRHNVTSHSSITIQEENESDADKALLSSYSDLKSFFISKGNALDVDQELEYVEMVTKVHEAGFTKIIIMVDIEDVKRKSPVTVDVYIFLHLSTAEPLCLLSMDL
jgi:hypothetical protein